MGLSDNLRGLQERADNRTRGAGCQGDEDPVSLGGFGDAVAARLARKAVMPYVLFMPTLTITAKGQVTFRKELLEHLGVAPGDKLLVERMPDGRVEVRAAPRPRKICEVFGMLKQENGPRLTIEEISEFAAKGWAGER